MPKVRFSIPHKLGKEEALQRIKKGVAGAKSMHGGQIDNLQEHWTGNTGKFSGKVMGYAISGAIIVHEQEVELEGELPWAAALFKGKIESLVKKQGQKLLK